VAVCAKLWSEGRRREDQIVSVRSGNGRNIGVGEPTMAARSGPSGPPPHVEERRPFGTVVASAVEGLRALARQQVELARLEATEAASIRARGTGMMAAAGILALFALGFGAAAGAAGLALVLPTWAAILIVAGVFVVAAAVLWLVARRAMRTAPTGVDRTRETLKEDARWAKQQIAR
jgi:hypothetical protein